MYFLFFFISIKIILPTMIYNFEINTTVINKPLKIKVNSDITTEELIECLLQTIEDYTLLYKNEVLDIFAHDTLNSDTISIPSSKQTVENFVQMNRNYFPISPVTKNTYKIYVIDRMYHERLVIVDDNAMKERKNKQIKTSHFGDFLNSIRKVFSFY